jgi:hypothetical protein
MSVRGSAWVPRRSRVAALIVLAVPSIAVSLAATATAALTNGDFGPDTCLNGFVWREAVPTDHVCVTPTVRTQTQQDNSLAASRRSSTGGPFGPDTCRSGFVWREAVVGDRVCVAPATRDQARSDNFRAAERRNELRTSLGTYGTPRRYYVRTDRLNVGLARVVLFNSTTRTSIRSWRFSVPQNPSAPGGLLSFRTVYVLCSGAPNAYFRVQDGSSGRWSSRQFVCARF